MSIRSNESGRGYEFACLSVLYEKIIKSRKCTIKQNSSFYAAERAWNLLDRYSKQIYLTSAASVVDTLFELEPLILEEENDVLELQIQPDSKGETGDVRDIVILRNQIGWEIGLSVKHNHFAVKHSRLAKTLDFSEKWFGKKCTMDYWDSVSVIFEYLQTLKKQNKKWSELPSKSQDIYIPILKAFIDEIIRQYNDDQTTPKKMVEYLLGEFDFYKVISVDDKKMTQVQSFNLHGTLNQPSRAKHPGIDIPIVALPTRIVNLDFKPNSTNTVELYLDNGWQFAFRIHNASSLIETSLKFDIQIIGMPTTVITFNCKWK